MHVIFYISSIACNYILIVFQILKVTLCEVNSNNNAMCFEDFKLLNKQNYSFRFYHLIIITIILQHMSYKRMLMPLFPMLDVPCVYLSFFEVKNSYKLFFFPC